MKIPFLVLMLALLGLLGGCNDEPSSAQIEVKELVADLSGSDEVSAASIDDQQVTVEEKEINRSIRCRKKSSLSQLPHMRRIRTLVKSIA